MAPTRRRYGPVWATLLLAFVLLGGGLLAIVLHHRARQAQFADACHGAVVGSPITTLERDFAAIDQHTSGHGWSADPSGPPDEHHWFRRTGLSRHQQCTVEVERASQHIVSVSLREGTDFTSCRDPIVYPRRHLLCTIADALAL